MKLLKCSIHLRSLNEIEARVAFKNISLMSNEPERKNWHKYNKNDASFCFRAQRRWFLRDYLKHKVEDGDWSIIIKVKILTTSHFFRSLNWFSWVHIKCQFVSYLSLDWVSDHVTFVNSDSETLKVLFFKIFKRF